jgi:hypothetical protein
MSWKCPEKYIKAYIFFIMQWNEFKFGIFFRYALRNWLDIWYVGVQ